VKISYSKLRKLLKLSRLGLPDRRVARRLNIAKTTVGSYRKKFKIKPAGHALRHAETILRSVNGVAKCRRCQRARDKESFRLPQLNVCSECQNQRQTFHLHTNLERYFGRKLAIARLYARRKNLPFELTTGDLVTMYNAQKRLCFYTDYPMVPNAGRKNKRQSVSVDRVVPEAGYTLGNIVLCTSQANLIKNDQTLEELRDWMPAWHKRLVEAGKVNG